LLLKEINHRVKNQFAVILSIIRETRSRASRLLKKSSSFADEA